MARISSTLWALRVAISKVVMGINSHKPRPQTIKDFKTHGSRNHPQRLVWRLRNPQKDIGAANSIQTVEGDGICAGKGAAHIGPETIRITWNRQPCAAHQI